MNKQYYFHILKFLEIAKCGTEVCKDYGLDTELLNIYIS